MRTSWTDQQLIEDYLAGRLSDVEINAFQSRLENDATFSEQFMWQKKTLFFVNQYGRQTIKQNLEFIHEHLFSHPDHFSFKQKILRFFNS